MPAKPDPEMDTRGRFAYGGCGVLALIVAFVAFALLPFALRAQTVSVVYATDSALLIAKMPACTTACPDSIVRVWTYNGQRYTRTVKSKATDSIRVKRATTATTATLEYLPLKSTRKSLAVSAWIPVPPPVPTLTLTATRTTIVSKQAASYQPGQHETAIVPSVTPATYSTSDTTAAKYWLNPATGGIEVFDPVRSGTVTVTAKAGSATGSIVLTLVGPTVITPPPVDTVKPPTPTPTPAPVGDSVIAAQIIRLASGTGSTVVSSGIPFVCGQMPAAKLAGLRVVVAGADVPLYVERLSGQCPDGTLRAALVQFTAAVDSGKPVVASIVRGGVAASRLAAPLSAQRGSPAAVILPSSPDYLVATQLVGPTLTAAQSNLVSAEARQYETDFLPFADKLWATSADTWTENYYDRAQAYWAQWIRTGNPLYWHRANRQLLSYRRDYLEANAYGTSPHWAQIDGLGLHYWLTGDTLSRYAIQRIVPVFMYFRDRTGLALKNSGDIENRIRARVLMASLWAWRTSDTPAVYTADMDKMLGDVLGAIEPDGAYKFTAICNASLHYMDGMLNEALIQYHTHYRQDPRILTNVKANADWMWASQWRPASEAFTYTPAACGTIGGAEAVPELNNLIVNGYAWVYAQTGDVSYRTKADAIFAGGVRHSFLYGSKQFTQQYSVGYRYFAYRIAR